MDTNELTQHVLNNTKLIQHQLRRQHQPQVDQTTLQSVVLWDLMSRLQTTYINRMPANPAHGRIRPQQRDLGYFIKPANLLYYNVDTDKDIITQSSFLPAIRVALTECADANISAAVDQLFNSTASVDLYKIIKLFDINNTTTTNHVPDYINTIQTLSTREICPN